MTLGLGVTPNTAVLSARCQVASLTYFGSDDVTQWKLLFGGTQLSTQCDNWKDWCGWEIFPIASDEELGAIHDLLTDGGKAMPPTTIGDHEVRMFQFVCSICQNLIFSIQ